MTRRIKYILLFTFAGFTLGLEAEINSMRKNGPDRNTVSPAPTQREVRPLLGPEGPFGKSGSGMQGELKRALSTMQQETHRVGDSSTNATEALTMIAVGDPDDYFERRGVQNLQLDLYGYEWIELFIKVLGCPKPSDEPIRPGEDNEQRRQRYKRRFQATLEAYPMLGRVWSTYAYVNYKPEEIELLRKECLNVYSMTSNEHARSGLSKLLSACDKSSSFGLGLMLIPD